MDDLGTLGGTYSYGWGINASGVVVGQAQTASGQYDAFVDIGGIMQDLNSFLPANSGIHLQDARGINDAGQIVANGYDAMTGRSSAFLLTPDAPTGSAVPLPHSAAAGVTLLGLLISTRWLRRRTGKGISAD